MLLQFITTNAYSEKVTYNAETKIVHIPTLEMNGSPIYTNIDLKIRDDGLLEVVNATVYINVTPEPASEIPFDLVLEKAKRLYKDEIYSINSGALITITGYSGDRVLLDSKNNYTTTFRISPGSLPAPQVGAKGAFYALDSATGGMVYANYVSQSMGNTAFELVLDGAKRLYKDEIYSINGGALITITGYSGDRVLLDRGNNYTTTFRTSLNSLPDPQVGTKGAFYALDPATGGLVYANYL